MTSGLLVMSRMARRGRTRPASSSVLPATRILLPSGKKAIRAIGPPVPSPGDLTSGLAAASQNLIVWSELLDAEPQAVGAEGHARDGLGVAAEREELLARRELPDLDGPVGAAGASRAALGAERHVEAPSPGGRPATASRPAGAASQSFTVRSQLEVAIRSPPGR